MVKYKPTIEVVYDAGDGFESASTLTTCKNIRNRLKHGTLFITIINSYPREACTK